MSKYTIEFIKSIVQINNTIYDYGCGPGLYTSLLQKEGFKVTGIDVSKRSLKYAKESNKSVEYLEMNYVTDKSPKIFNFAMMIYCDFGALDPHSQVKVLKNIRDSLSNEGLFFFDVMSHNFFDNQIEREITYDEIDGFFMSGKSNITSKFVKYSKQGLLLPHYHAFGHKEVNYYNRDKCFDEKEMETLLNRNGIQIINTYSNTFGDKDFSNSDTISFLCVKK